MLENSLFLLRVLIILELDLPVFQDGILDTVDDVIDLLIMWFDPA